MVSCFDIGEVPRSPGKQYWNSVFCHSFSLLNNVHYVDLVLDRVGVVFCTLEPKSFAIQVVQQTYIPNSNVFVYRIFDHELFQNFFAEHLQSFFWLRNNAINLVPNKVLLCYLMLQSNSFYCKTFCAKINWQQILV